MITPNHVLDAKGLACPMPIVKTKKIMKDVEAGQVLEIQATDKGSTADLQAWAKSTGHEYLGTETEGDVLRHFLRKGGADTASETIVIPEISLEDFKEKVENGEHITILDVREADEYQEGHIDNAIHIPLGEVEQRSNELEKDELIYVICHSGRRSELAAQTMSKQGFKKLMNVVPGMCHWTGKTVK
ncbi:sulfurtransferase TusA family protein [Domibacillus sp. DTU_2020_1001157_1_SI_ALB_TIR_016]|uniref:sulfurtransferase TusA family protein n=1 Tax=Domibacillus sp. DTU_2020_1001157_1_SI_ALB_TIR_016 TaxID=3077789 RepID=UPI0028F06AF5|nr:sulfurtransferase TusA family protein [Domibacillus sp. DTU_2020_1001157_1_SI_ALB_TIR_016]WNS79257.1 sulfurtransferase TusA family protein [Domibacillus sp. DTU_2020_1001157_1_SI_ALB_TIR_016]